ncbi:putative patatin/cPLA2 family phospholipase [Cytobacillus firmus]|uniref:Putative patatin/cPLA2 family phospholipase n=2 Tax=Cytobacillus TaxID=2675230 RepID=A0A366JIT1_CYTFI|nr:MULTISPECIES: patatin family protein [Cytobacillus]RBP87039.1 putative patatin/cPLA2 family phospholipase [Cytobacillus firmus]TDX46956.1 putative patatin/cPLA2 family phospholipase [Cytobacillus oceanisediminis]
MIREAGLVLEGGGMRGVYTAGVLEYFLEQDLFFPYVIGVSAGACNAASYLSKQKGRNRIVNVDYVTDSRYISWRNYFKSRQFFGMDFIFDEIPNKLVPYHYDEFYKNKSEFVIGTTDCHTGKPVYFSKKDYGKDMLKVLKASSSLPFIAPEVDFNSRVLLDGGISDPIPIKKAQQDGFKKNIVILTRNRGYSKKPSKFTFMVKRKYPQYTGLQKALEERYRTYNETLRYVEQEEKKGTVLVIQPQEPLTVGRMERNPQKLEKLYLQGYEDARKSFERINQF